ncbi:hypothetical protein RJ640_010015 [Escallonia rubra]|uniref:Rotamase n=1 Tax=Escallonia rubra TaxID=112253 RepID=A0AA88RH09_9ASTE|nr:hypothetical protein RJ640_010015 [Escallonia rubra]
MDNVETGFEEGIGDMRPGGKRRIIIPPELGPHNSQGSGIGTFEVQGGQGFPGLRDALAT